MFVCILVGALINVFSLCGCLDVFCSVQCKSRLPVTGSERILLVVKNLAWLDRIVAPCCLITKISRVISGPVFVFFDCFGIQLFTSSKCQSANHQTGKFDGFFCRQMCFTLLR